MIAIIDYGMGNVRSLINAIDYLGEDAILTDRHSDIDNASHVILPGVGAFGDAMKRLKEKDLIPVLEEQIFQKGKPFLGICLGMQLLANYSEEHGVHMGLGWIEGSIVKFVLSQKEYKIPHMGWNDISVVQRNPLFFKLGEDNTSFYFVHSFHFQNENEQTISATCNHGISFTAAIQKDNILGTQFHPEKSQDNGLHVLGNFLKWKI